MSITVDRQEAPVLGLPLADADPEVHAALDRELARQRDTLEMIASGNFAPFDTLARRHPLYTELRP